jgi:alpha-galactosidase
MDAIYSVPPCYNPKHHHKSPEDSIKAVAQLFQVIYDTARQLKPESHRADLPLRDHSQHGVSVF